MTIRLTVPNLIRLALYAVVLSLVTLQGGAQAQALPATIRIGLQTKQPEVRLSSTLPIKLEAGKDALPLPENLTLVCTPKNGGVLVSDANGVKLFEANGAVRVSLDPQPPATRERDPEAPRPLQAIKLLGPTRHYDGKIDRPYRGAMELLPRPEGLTVVNIVEFEPYLWGVVSSEMSPAYHMEALKAQAVAARTYAAKNLGRLKTLGFDLDDTAACQVYGGVFSEHPRTTQAVNETAGVVLTYDGKLVDAVYSSTCGGFTESAEHAWGKAVPYLVSVSDVDPTQSVMPDACPVDETAWAKFFKTNRGPYCLQPKHANPEAFRWVRLITRQEIEAGLPADFKVGILQNIVPVQRGTSGRITALKIEGSERTVTIEKELPIRKALLGLRSSAFTVDVYRDDNGTPVVFAFWGAGWGHGLGMCQVGAVGRAESGATFQQILTHYYRGAKLEKW